MKETGRSGRSPGRPGPIDVKHVRCKPAIDVVMGLEVYDRLAPDSAKLALSVMELAGSNRPARMELDALSTIRAVSFLSCSDRHWRGRSFRNWSGLARRRHPAIGLPTAQRQRPDAKHDSGENHQRPKNRDQRGQSQKEQAQQQGPSGRAMFAALLDGEQDPDVLANLARGRLRAKLPELRQALEGRVQPHHLMLIGQILAHIDALDETIPGIKAVAAAAILAEIGPDMSRFPSAGHLASWAGLCPSNKESAGKGMKGPVNRGNVWLRAIMGEVAWASEYSNEGELLLRPVPPTCSSARQGEGGDSRGAQPLGRHLSRVEYRPAVP